MNKKIIISLIVISFISWGCAQKNDDTTAEPSRDDQSFIANDRSVDELRNQIIVLESRIRELEGQLDAATNPSNTLLLSLPTFDEVNNSLLWIAESRSDCTDNLCSQFILQADGSFRIYRINGAEAPSFLSPEDLATLKSSLLTADATLIPSRSDKTNCNESSYAFSINTEVDFMQFSNCTHDLSNKPSPVDTILSIITKYGYEIHL